MFPNPSSKTRAGLSVFVLAASILNAADEPAAKEAAPASGPRRQGGGPENPELKFRPPPPPALSPAEEMKTFKVAPGFKVELVASEPMIESPIAMSWDDQGRLYVCEMRGYMHDVDGTGEDQPLGRISRLEDTDGDGKMDKSTVFADKLVMPRTVMALGDGALVAEPPNLIFFHDTDGDGVADKKEIVSKNYASAGGQPEHMANSATWMMDNWIWSSNHNARYRYQGGAFLAAPTQGFGQWGRTQDDWGRQYFNYNSDFLRCDVVPPDFYARNPRLTETTASNFKVMADQTTWPAGPTPGVNRGYDGKTLRDDGTLKSCTATCGATIYRGDLFPPEYRGNAFIPEPSGNLIKRIVLGENGALLTGKNAEEGTEFLTSTDERFRPVNAGTGPDGALYIVDMARGVIQHKGFLTYYLVANIQDRKLEAPVNAGRIYRIVPEGAKPVLVKLPRETAQIVPLLAHANGEVRDRAQRVLVERADPASAEAVKKIAASGPTPQARVQSLWTLEGLNALTPSVISASLKDSDANVRAAAVRLADPSLAPELAKLASDPSATVALQLAFKLSALPGSEPTLIAMLAKSGDPVFAEGIASGLAGRELEFLELLAQQPAAQIDASGIFQMLAGCVMKERRPARVAQLLALAAAQPEGPRQLALLNGMAGKPLAKNAPAPKPIVLTEAPAALTTLAAHPKTKSLAERLDPFLAWKDKPGYTPAPPPTPLTPEQQALFEKGKVLYALCAACHQPTGTGLAGLAPPLLDSEWALGPADRPIRIVLHGLTGPIEVEGVKWQLEMPALPTLADEDLASILTYIRREWGHGASPVQPADVANVRATFSTRTSAWTAAELLKSKPTEQADRK